MCDSWCCRHHKAPKLVCFKHRFVAKTTKRRPWNKTGWGVYYNHCPICRKSLENVGSGVKIPLKTQDAAWKKFERWFRSQSKKGSR